MPARIQTNEQALEEAADLQQKSKDATLRMQQRLRETEDMGVMTLDDLYERRRQMKAIEDETNRIHETLDDTEQLQAKFGSWFGWIKPNTSKAMRKIDDTISSTQAEHEANSARKKSPKIWKKAFRSPKKNKTEDTATAEVPKGLLEGEDVTAGTEYEEQIRALDKGDKELDNQLDLLGLQLENLTALAEEIGTETKLQTKQMGKVRDNMIDVHVRQLEATDRARKFIGDARCKPEKEESIVPKPSLF